MPEPVGTKVYDVGDGIRTTITFKVQGTATDPDTVTFKFKAPDGTITTREYPSDPAVVKDSTGVYHTTIAATSSGTWWYRWSGTGAAMGAIERMFQVRPTQFGT